MRIIAIFSLALFLNGCVDDDEIKLLTSKTGTKEVARAASGDELAMSPQYQAFVKEFQKEFPDYVSLPLPTLYQIIDAVPEQGTTSWSCGNIQSGLARASASIAASEPIDKASLSRCNIVDDYPLLADVIIPEAGKKALTQAGYSLQYDDKDGHFRVGALPQKLAIYLNSEDKLPQSIRARHVKKDLLPLNDFIAELDKALAINMPLIVLYVINPAKMQLHYYGVVGYDKNKLNLLILETDGAGINRLSMHEGEEFIRHLNTDDFAVVVKKFEPVVGPLQLLFNVTGKIPKVAELAGLGAFNMITFDKTK
jgi:hypothetical protein